MTGYYTMAYSQLYVPHWLDVPRTPIMIPASTCVSRYTGRLRVPQLAGAAWPVVLDSGWFVYASRHEDYPFTVRDYWRWSRSFGAKWTAIMDSPCEQSIASDDGAVLERQMRSVRRACELLMLGEFMPDEEGKAR